MSTPEAIAVTAHLAGPLSTQGGPIALDSLLAWAKAMRDQYDPFELVPIEIPIAREPGGRFHLCSFGQWQIEQREHRFINRRFPIQEAQEFGSLKIRTVRITAGPAKSYRLPTEVGYVEADEIRWWALATDKDEVTSLLDLVSHLGKKRSVGLGRVTRWQVEPCEPWDGFPIVRDGKPLRVLPSDWPGLESPSTAYRRLTYPYWTGERVLCAVP